MVEQNRAGTYTEVTYSPTGFKMQLMNGATAKTDFVPLPGGAMAVYSGTAPSGGYWIRHPDWLGSSRLASNPNRTVLYDGAYAPFGEPYAQSGTTDLSYTGMNQDTSTGLYDFLYREYSTQGRWSQPDPAGLAAVDPSNPQSWNRYAYVLNNPLALVDPSGLICDGADGVGMSVGGNPADGTGIFTPEDCALNGGTWIDPVTTTVVVSGNDGDPGLGGSGLPPGGCAFFYQDGNFDGTQCGNNFKPPTPTPPTSEQYITAIAKALPAVCGGGVFVYAGFQPGKSTKAADFEGFGGYLGEWDSNTGKWSNNVLLEGGTPISENGIAVNNKGAEPLWFFPVAEVGGVVTNGLSTGVYAGTPNLVGVGGGAFVNITTAAGCPKGHS